MRADVAQNASVLLRVPKPLRPAAAATTCITASLRHLVRSDVNRLDHLADSAVFHQLAGLYSRAHLQTFAVQNGVDTLRLCDGLAHECEVFHRSYAWLIAEEVLAMLHRTDAQCSSL